MQVREAIEILKQMDPNKEVKLTFSDQNHSSDTGPYSRGSDGTDHPCGGSYEAQR